MSVFPVREPGKARYAFLVRLEKTLLSVGNLRLQVKFLTFRYFILSTPHASLAWRDKISPIFLFLFFFLTSLSTFSLNVETFQGNKHCHVAHKEPTPFLCNTGAFFCDLFFRQLYLQNYAGSTQSMFSHYLLH